MRFRHWNHHRNALLVLLVTPGNLHFGQHGSYQNLIIANSHVFFDSEFLLTCKKPSKTGCGAQFLHFRLGSRKHRKKNFIRTRVFLLSVLLAQLLSELLPPVSVVEAPHVAVHILFHSGIEASIRLASTAQAFGNMFFQMRPDFV